MFSVDVPDLPPPYASVLVAQSNQVTMAAARKERAAGICYAIDYNSTPNENSSFLSPHTVAVDYFKRFEKRDVAAPQPTDIELITRPRHGKVVYQIYQGMGCRILCIFQIPDMLAMKSWSLEQRSMGQQ